MEDYAGNSKKAKEGSVPDKKIEKVVTGELIVKKPSLGQKVKGLFIEMDLRSVTRYVVSDVLIPAARNMIVDASTKGIERMMYGDRAVRPRGFGPGPRVTYNSPISRTDYRSPLTRPPSAMPRHPRSDANDFILTTKEEATLVLDKMYDIIEMYQVVTVADLHELVGYPTTHVDQKWGWVDLSRSTVRPVREGYIIDLPPSEPI